MPTITFTTPEGQVWSRQLTADRPVTWAKKAGIAPDPYTITTAGLLTLPPQTYKEPIDGQNSNTYMTTVQATDAAGLFSTIFVTGTVTDVATTAPLPRRANVYLIEDIDRGLGTTASPYNEIDDEALNALALQFQDYINIVGLAVDVPTERASEAAAGYSQIFPAYETDRPNLITYTSTPTHFKTVAQLEALVKIGPMVGNAITGNAGTPTRGYRISGDPEYAAAKLVADDLIAKAKLHGNPTSTDPLNKLWIFVCSADTCWAQAQYQAIELGQCRDFNDRVIILKPSKQNSIRDVNARKYIWNNTWKTSGVPGKFGDLYLIQAGINPVSRQEVAMNDTTTAGKSWYDTYLRGHGALGAFIEGLHYSPDSDANQNMYFRAADAWALFWLIEAIRQKTFGPGNASNGGGGFRLYNTGEKWVDSAAGGGVIATTNYSPSMYADDTAKPMPITKFRNFYAEAFDRSKAARTTTPDFTLYERETLGGTAPATLTVTGTPPNGTVNAAYSYQYGTAGGSGTKTFAATSIPAGLTMSSAGLLSGAPTTAATYNISVTVSDTTGTSVAKVNAIVIAAAGALDATTTAWINAAVAAGGVAPSGARQTQYNNLIVALKASTAWATRDRVLIGATHDPVFARFDVKSATQVLAVVGTPVFVVNNGYHANAAGYLTDTFNPTVAGQNYAQDNAGIMLACSSSDMALSGGGRMITQGNTTTSYVSITPRANSTDPATTNFVARLNNTAAVNINNVEGKDFYTISRSAAASFRRSKHKAQFASTSASATSTALQNLAFRYLADAATTPAYALTGNSLRFVSIGAAVSTAEETAFYDAYAAYIVAIGQTV